MRHARHGGLSTPSPVAGQRVADCLVGEEQMMAMPRLSLSVKEEGLRRKGGAVAIDAVAGGRTGRQSRRCGDEQREGGEWRAGGK